MRSRRRQNDVFISSRVRQDGGRTESCKGEDKHDAEKKKRGGWVEGSEGVADEIRVERRRGMHTAGGREGGRDNERE